MQQDGKAIELTGVTKTFGPVTAVDDLSLQVPPGTVYGFIGPNGSGKTTTLRMIMNIFYPDHGDIRVFGRPISKELTDRIGYLPEERGLYRKMKVGDVIRFYGELKSGKDVGAQTDAWLKRLDLFDWRDRKVEALSKGMSQKVQFICAVVSDPELLILDEPFAGLDPVNADVMREAVLEFQSRGRTVIFSTHDMGIAERMCDFIFMIFKGRKVLDGTLESIQEEYGLDTIRARTDCGGSGLKGIRGVERVNDFGRIQELRIGTGADSQEVLREIMARTRIHGFDVVKPSLHDIFVRIAGPEAREAVDA
jgi:ABC-2 type transport system ATP-binding protein